MKEITDVNEIFTQLDNIFKVKGGEKIEDDKKRKFFTEFSAKIPKKFQDAFKARYCVGATD